MINNVLLFDCTQNGNNNFYNKNLKKIKKWKE